LAYHFAHSPRAQGDFVVALLRLLLGRLPPIDLVIIAGKDRFSGHERSLSLLAAEKQQRKARARRR
jgi:hypothetical protein